MTAEHQPLVLDARFVRARRIEMNVSCREIATALGMSEAGWRRIEGGSNDRALTLAQLNVVARLLAVPVIELLSSGDGRAAVDDVDDLDARVGTILQVAGRAVPIAMLAAVTGATTEAIAAALDRLRDRLAPAGLVISVSATEVSLVPGARSLRDAAVRDLLRTADLRGALPAPAARMLHRLARGEALPQTPKKDERSRIALLLRGGWITPGEGSSAGIASAALHPDVRYSLALDDGFACEVATTTPHPAVRRLKLPWLRDAAD